jgi:hypothetical protein
MIHLSYKITQMYHIDNVSVSKYCLLRNIAYIIFNTADPSAHVYELA